jgi:tRNA (cmo5U34)-methyltransferase
MPKVFDKMAPYLVPQYDFLQETVYDIINFEEDKEFVIVDIRAGSGIQIEKILTRFPNSKAVYVDSSIPFTDIAKKRLK